MHVVSLLGSPSATSRSASLLRLALQRLDDQASSLHEIAVRDLPPGALLAADVRHPALAAAIEQVLAADVVLVATPIYKAAYSGLLKAFLDLLPQDGLRGKSVLPLATGGSAGHLLALDYALKPVLAALGARHIADAVYAVDGQLLPQPGLGHAPAAELLARLDRALAGLVEHAPRRRVLPLRGHTPLHAARFSV